MPYPEAAGNPWADPCPPQVGESFVSFTEGAVSNDATRRCPIGGVWQVRRRSPFLSWSSCLLRRLSVEHRASSPAPRRPFSPWRPSKLTLCRRRPSLPREGFWGCLVALVKPGSRPVPLCFPSSPSLPGRSFRAWFARWCPLYSRYWNMSFVRRVSVVSRCLLVICALLVPACDRSFRSARVAGEARREGPLLSHLSLSRGSALVSTFPADARLRLASLVSLAIPPSADGEPSRTESVVTSEDMVMPKNPRHGRSGGAVVVLWSSSSQSKEFPRHPALPAEGVGAG